MFVVVVEQVASALPVIRLNMNMLVEMPLTQILTLKTILTMTLLLLKKTMKMSLMMIVSKTYEKKVQTTSSTSRGLLWGRDRARGGL